MGNFLAPSTSSTTANILTNVAINAATQVVQQCITSAVNNQNVTFSSGGNVNLNGITVAQNSSVNVSCVMSNHTQSQIASQVANALVQEVASKTGSLSAFGTASHSTAVINVTNQIKSNINISSMQTQMVSAIQNQNVGVYAGGNITVSSSNISQTSNTIAKFIIGNSAYANTISSLSNKVNQSAKSTGSSTGLGSISQMIIIGIVLIAIIIAVVVVASS